MENAGLGHLADREKPFAHHVRIMNPKDSYKMDRVQNFLYSVLNLFNIEIMANIHNKEPPIIFKDDFINIATKFLHFFAIILLKT